MRGVSGSLTECVLLAVESLRHKETLDGTISLRRSIELLPRCMAKLQHNDFVNAALFSPDGQMLATLGGTPRIWDVQTGQELQRLEHDGQVRAAVFSPNGKELATASSDGTARIWTLDIREVMKDACRRATENMTRKEWTRYL